MKQLRIGLGLLCCVVLLSGCGSKSMEAWLSDETGVKDDRLAGVWRGDFFMSEDQEPRLKSFVIATVYDPEDGEEAETPGPVVYKVAVYWGDSLSGVDHEGGHLGEVEPTRYFATLHEVGETLLLQACGYYNPKDPYQLITPFWLLFKLSGSDEEQVLRLHQLAHQGWNETTLREAGLLVRYDGEGQYFFFSNTDDLEPFIREHLADEGFFEHEPWIVLQRISDTSGQTEVEADED